MEGHMLQETPESFLLGGVMLHTKSGKVFVDGRQEHVSKSEMRLLALLMRNAGTLVSRDMFMEELYSDSEDCAEDKIVDVFICRLRKKLDPNDPYRFIQTVWKRGYQFAKPSIGIP